MPILSYAQRYEDLHLMRCFGGRAVGFYIDVGAGHPVHDNVSFAFYLEGWSGITVEPNPRLARLSRAVRPRDAAYQALAGAAEGEATFYLVEEFHGLSSMIEANARETAREMGKAVSESTVPVRTLAAMCAECLPVTIDFLKVDVEGAEKDVLSGADWQNFRPRIVLAEAFSPVTFEPAWTDWEPILLANGYRFVFTENLNRYYVAEEAAALADCFKDAPDNFDDSAVMFGMLGPAREDPKHPDHELARLLPDADLAQLPLLESKLVFAMLTAGTDANALNRPATQADVAAIRRRLLGSEGTGAALPALATDATLRDVYAAVMATAAFRAACGRISASYAF
jgi:FkbM family methyltransferase